MIDQMTEVTIKLLYNLFQKYL